MRTERRCTVHDLPKVAREGTHFFLPEPGEPDCQWEEVYVIPVDKAKWADEGYVTLEDTRMIPEGDYRVLVVEADDD